MSYINSFSFCRNSHLQLKSFLKTQLPSKHFAGRQKVLIICGGIIKASKPKHEHLNKSDREPQSSAEQNQGSLVFHEHRVQHLRKFNRGFRLTKNFKKVREVVL